MYESSNAGVVVVVHTTALRAELNSVISVRVSIVGLLAIRPPSKNLFIEAVKNVGAAPLLRAACHIHTSIK